MREWDRFWPCRANWEAAKRCSPKVFVAGIGKQRCRFQPYVYDCARISRWAFACLSFRFFSRWRDRQSLARLGLDDYFFGDGVSVIEWADRFPEFIPEQARWILFEIKSENQRAITSRNVKILALELSTARGSLAWLDDDGAGLQYVTGRTTGKIPVPFLKISTM